MTYDECKPLDTRVASIWTLRLPNGRQKILICDKAFTFPEVHQMCRNHYPDGFRLGVFGVGELTAVEVEYHGADTGWCPDARQFDQDLNFITSVQRERWEVRVDPAAVLGIALALQRGAKPGDDVSATYDGADEFMRQCLRVGNEFEAWASCHVNFEAMSDVWPYFLEDNFVEAMTKHGKTVLQLTGLGMSDWPGIATHLRLSLYED